MSRTSYLRRPLTAVLMAAALAASLVIAAVVLASPAWAATYTVNNTNDSGAGSLRQAIIDANTSTGVADTINFNLGSAATILLTSAQLPIITDGAGLTIDGRSANITINGLNSYRVFEVGSGAKLTLSNLAVEHGAPAGRGGGIFNRGGTLVVSNSTLSNNFPANGGGGIANDSGTVTVSNSTLSGNSATFGGGGGILNAGTATVSNSTLSDNSAPDGSGGGIYNSAFATLELSNSTLSGNSATFGGGGGILNAGTATVSNSTLSGNSASEGFGEGGGILNYDTLELSNSTLSGNSAIFGGGIYNYVATATVSNSTLSGNSASEGGGIYEREGFDRFTPTFKNTIVANNPSASGGSCNGNITNGGYNLDSDGSCGFGTTNNSLSNVDPMLGALADNGGPTLTHALLEGSPAIGKGNNAFAVDANGNALQFDQRGEGFARIVGARVDIGALEVQSTPDTTAPRVITNTTVPAAGATSVAPGVNVKATFTEAMDASPTATDGDPSTIKGTTFKLMRAGTTTVIGAVVSYDATTKIATLNPNANLLRGTKYKAVVTTGAEDLAGNRLDQNSSLDGLQQKSWTFTTRN